MRENKFIFWWFYHCCPLSSYLLLTLLYSALSLCISERLVATSRPNITHNNPMFISFFCLSTHIKKRKFTFRNDVENAVCVSGVKTELTCVKNSLYRDFEMSKGVRGNGPIGTFHHKLVLANRNMRLKWNFKEFEERLCLLRKQTLNYDNIMFMFSVPKEENKIQEVMLKGD